MRILERNIINIYHQKGKDWLVALPEKVQDLEVLWELSQLKPFPNLTYNYVLSGFQGDNPIVLKLSIDHFSLDNEKRALEVFQGHGAVSVIEDREGALLLQRAIPGKSLKGEPKAIEIACRVIEKLHKAPQKESGHFPHIQELLAALDKDWGLPKDYVEKAKVLKNQLLKVEAPQRLLHGDLHQDNILSNGNDWLVIDPKGVIGYPINEVWACVENPDHDLKYVSENFNYNFDDVVKWYYVHQMLAACWQVEDNQDPARFLALAKSIFPHLS